jgi:hypothetical protein
MEGGRLKVTQGTPDIASIIKKEPLGQCPSTGHSSIFDSIKMKTMHAYERTLVLGNILFGKKKGLTNAYLS